MSCYRYSTVSQHELKVPDAENRTTDLFPLESFDIVQVSGIVQGSRSVLAATVLSSRIGLRLSSYLSWRASQRYNAAKSLLPYNKEPGKSRPCRDPLVHEAHPPKLTAMNLNAMMLTIMTDKNVLREQTRGELRLFIILMGNRFRRHVLCGGRPGINIEVIDRLRLREILSRVVLERIGLTRLPSMNCASMLGGCSPFGPQQQGRS